jgi:hypothetical protein
MQSCESSMAGVSSVSCAICCDSAEEREKWSTLLTCGHVFHSTCLESWLQSGDSNPCPTCRVSSRNCGAYAMGSATCFQTAFSACCRTVGVDSYQFAGAS